jgi:hypothetical protein
VFLSTSRKLQAPARGSNLGLGLDVCACFFLSKECLNLNFLDLLDGHDFPISILHQGHPLNPPNHGSDIFDQLPLNFFAIFSPVPIIP